MGHRQQLHTETQFAGVVDVAGLELIDAFGGDRLAIHESAVGKAGEDGDLVGGITALHIGGGIGFRVAKGLGIGEHCAVAGPLLGHAAEDVIGGAVDDAAHPLDAVGPQGLL